MYQSRDVKPPLQPREAYIPLLTNRVLADCTHALAGTQKTQQETDQANAAAREKAREVDAKVDTMDDTSQPEWLTLCFFYAISGPHSRRTTPACMIVHSLEHSLPVCRHP